MTGYAWMPLRTWAGPTANLHSAPTNPPPWPNIWSHQWEVCPRISPCFGVTWRYLRSICRSPDLSWLVFLRLFDYHRHTEKKESIVPWNPIGTLLGISTSQAKFFLVRRGRSFSRLWLATYCRDIPAASASRILQLWEWVQFRIRWLSSLFGEGWARPKFHSFRARTARRKLWVARSCFTKSTHKLSCHSD